jgi:murein DD-endopeptidase MepM/ murein hydrolase activator NlpD
MQKTSPFYFNDFPHQICFMKLFASTGLVRTAAAVALFFTILLPWTAAAQDHSGSYPAIQASSYDVANGGTLLLEIENGAQMPAGADMHIRYNKRSFPVYRHPTRGDGAYFALIGIPYQTKPGPQKLTLTYSDANGDKSRQIPFQVVAGKYKTDILKVDGRRVNPDKKDRQRASREAQEVKYVYVSGSQKRLWDGEFQLPVDNEISSRFGNRRVFNGQLKSYHNGLDFRSPKGTPVYATNSGVVRLAKNLFYSGNAVIIDHGTGIFTIYAHLSKIEAAAGQRIEKGQLIGLTGATGRVSGPHLHWGVKIDGIPVNPLGFVEVMNGLVR